MADRKQTLAELDKSIAVTRKEVQRARRDRNRKKEARKTGKPPTSLAAVATATRVVKKLSARLAKRRAQRKRAASTGGVANAIKAALGRVGTREQGYNTGPFISDIIRAGGGTPGWPYCAYGVEWFLTQAGGPQYQGGLADMFRVWGNNGTNGFKAVSKYAMEPGDVVMFDWNSNGTADHVGVYIGGGKTWEANTSPGSSGSQNDGEGIWIRSRGVGNVCAVARPPYSKWS